NRFKTELEYTKLPGASEFSRDVKGTIKSTNFAGSSLTMQVESSKSMRDILRQADIGVVVEDGDRFTIQVLKPLEPTSTVTNPLTGQKLGKAQLQTALRNVQSPNFGIKNEAIKQLANAEPAEDSRTSVRSVLRPLVQKYEEE